MAQLTGDDSNNILTSTTSADTMSGGLGDDIYEFGGQFASGNSVVELTNEGEDTIHILDDIPASAVRLISGNGAYNNPSDRLWIAADGFGSIAINGHLTRANVEWLQIGNNAPISLTGGLTMTGSSGDNFMFGSEFDDIINGGEGGDTLTGRKGDDTYEFTGQFGSGNTVAELTNEGEDTIHILDDIPASAVRLISGNGAYNNPSDRLWIAADGFGSIAINGHLTRANVEWLQIGNNAPISLTGGLTMTGSSGDNFMFGSEFDDIINGGEGGDTLTGRKGDDTYEFTGQFGSGNTVAELTNEGDDTIHILDDIPVSAVRLISGNGAYNNPSDRLWIAADGFGSIAINGHLTRANVEWLQIGNNEPISLTGGLTMTGSSGDNFMFGSEFDDIINGMEGNDRITADEGNDTIDGGVGSDSAVFPGLFSQASIAYAPNFNTFVVTTILGGTDIITNTETFIFDDRSVASADLIGVVDTVDSLPSSTTQPVLSIDDITVSEGPGTKTATFVIESSAPAAETISGNFEIIAGTATAGSDFQSDSGTFTIPAGEASATVDVTILDDTAVENTETFQLRLFDVSNAELSGGGSTVTATGQITDTDSPPDNGNNTPVDPDSDIAIVQRGVVSKAAGDDIYVISSATVDPNASISISDAQGANKIQLIDGLNIESSIVASNTALLTLSNGAEIVILDAASFTYETGGNPLIPTSGVVNNYADFVSNILGISVPAASETPNNGGAVIIDSDGVANASAIISASKLFQPIEDGQIELIQGDSSITLVDLIM
ncbi:Hemolysin-type calcium-binding repeat-containing protein [Nitrosomonas marina]|uniref:Hemolysin-type calcium-binding repeat-containing protein n=1 Tax=Nitrosomonas marina TaxID=917 RepID=A0A1I0CSI7_9PROT|nr:Calx-beta domain-containing protein [Nitrosomonas marina]SET22676.1 Hemolysin-type calcium-binding repeat-containing protein [Nitrosomonas marina]